VWKGMRAAGRLAGHAVARLKSGVGAANWPSGAGPETAVAGSPRDHAVGEGM
jgi:hypothetical protein